MLLEDVLRYYQVNTKEYAVVAAHDHSLIRHCEYS